MSERPYMPLYTADYKDATAHLSAAQHGAYLLLLMNYWTKGSLPTEDKLLARIACMSDREWKANRNVIAGFFDTDWKQTRVEKELEKARIKSEARAASGARGGEAKSLKYRESTVANATILPQQKPSKTLPSSSGSGTVKEEDTSLRSVGRGKRAAKAIETPMSPDAVFEELHAEIAKKCGLTEQQGRFEFQKFQSHHLARGHIYKDWFQAFRTWCLKTSEYSSNRGNRNEPSPQYRPSGPRESPYVTILRNELAAEHLAGGNGISGRDADNRSAPDGFDFESRSDRGLFAGYQAEPGNGNGFNVVDLVPIKSSR